MPQFDFTSFSGQINWLTIFFFSYYFICIKSVLYSAALILKYRYKFLQLNQKIFLFICKIMVKIPKVGKIQQ